MLQTTLLNAILNMVLMRIVNNEVNAFIWGEMVGTTQKYNAL